MSESLKLEPWDGWLNPEMTKVGLITLHLIHLRSEVDESRKLVTFTATRRKHTEVAPLHWKN